MHRKVKAKIQEVAVRIINPKNELKNRIREFLRRNYRHCIYLGKHKWYVTVECWKMGLYWQGLVHDWSKFLPREWFAYTNYWYGEKTPENEKKFDKAWFWHVKLNRHHWQWWVLPDRYGTFRVVRMPVKYAMEMAADWIGAARAQGNDVKIWYKEHYGKIVLHPETRILVEALMGFSEQPHNGLTNGVTKHIEL